MNTYTVTCTIQYGFPVGRYKGFGRTEIHDGLERTQPKRTTIYNIRQRSMKSAQAEMDDKIRRMKQVYNTDGWACFEEEDSLTFVSDKGVFNYYTEWRLEETK